MEDGLAAVHTSCFYSVVFLTFAFVQLHSACFYYISYLIRCNETEKEARKDCFQGIFLQIIMVSRKKEEELIKNQGKRKRALPQDFRYADLFV
jgi:hypothetical protein